MFLFLCYQIVPGDLNHLLLYFKARGPYRIKYRQSWMPWRARRHSGVFEIQEGRRMGEEEKNTPFGQKVNTPNVEW